MTSEEHGRWNGTDSPSHETKFCPHCEQYRPVDEFARRRKDLDLRQAWCRECINLTRREAYDRRKGAPDGR